MFFLLLLSILQICFLPGFIVFFILNRKPDDTRLLLAPVLCFGLSLLINYLVVMLLIWFQVYTKPALLIIILTELLLLAGLYAFYKSDLKAYSYHSSFKKFLDEAKQFLNFKGSISDKIQSVLFILSVLVLTGMIIQMLINVGKIFHGWDAIFSWNRWAIDFYNNKIPASTYHYPLLIPANWSMSYVLCGYPLQFIAKAMMPLFLIFQVYAFIVLGIKRKSFLFIYAVIFLFMAFNRLNWTEGFVDVPVAFFSILVFICLSLIRKEDEEKDKWNYIFLSAILACGSAVTKQAGIFVVVIYPFLLILLTKDKFTWDSRKIIKFTLLFFLLILIIIVPYYVYAEIAIKKGIAASEVHYVTNEIYNGASWFERVMNAGKMFSNLFRSRILFFICLIPFLISFTNKSFRFLNLAIVLPYLLIWTLYFSYDLRNSAIIIPYFCLAIGAGIDLILRRLQKNTGNE
jgi:hypothetical protein